MARMDTSSFSDVWVNKMSAYGDFSLVYDSLTEDVDYKGRTEYLYGLFKSFGAEPQLLLDLACGTGSFSLEFANLGVDVIGVDPSEDMLSVAREKAESAGKDILFLCQSAQELELYGTVDGAVCCLDSVNHITDADELLKAFSKVSLFLEPDKLFIFDVNTEYKHQTVLGDNTFVFETDNVFSVWQNEYEEESKSTSVMLDFFVKDNSGYQRFSEDFCERAYSREILEKMLSMAGFELLAVYDDMQKTAPTAESERNIYVARKVK